MCCQCDLPEDGKSAFVRSIWVGDRESPLSPLKQEVVLFDQVPISLQTSWLSSHATEGGRNAGGGRISPCALHYAVGVQEKGSWDARFLDGYGNP